MKKGLFALTLGAVLLFVVSCSGGGTDNLSFGSAHYDLASTRNVPVTDITKDNIKDLGVVWKADFKALDANIPNGNQNFPIVVDGVLYTTTGQNHIFAFDAATGAQKWHWTPDAELVATATKLHGGANRGVAVDGGFVYIVLYDNRVTKIDAKTGSTVTEAKIAELLPELKDVTTDNGYYETSLPVISKGIVYIGSSGSDNGVRGFVMALKATDLTAAWDAPFWAVPPKGQDWLATSHFNGGGTTWMPITVDVATDIIYFGTGNPAPDFYGENRPGANPDVDSVVAVDGKTGKKLWAQQFVAHDLWDYDVAASPMLLNAKIGDKVRKIVVDGGKGGEWWAFDAATGEPIYKNVAFNKQDHVPVTTEGVLGYPGILGGQNYAPEAYDPASNYVLIPGIEYPSFLRASKDQDSGDASFGFGALTFGTMWDIGATPKDVVPYGTVTAVDVATGKIVYTNKTDTMMRGGFTTTGTGLAFYGEGNGKFRAIDVKSGATVWEFQLDGDSIGAAPTIYKVAGKVYVAITSGGAKPKLHVFGFGGDKTQATPAAQ